MTNGLTRRTALRTMAGATAAAALAAPLRAAGDTTVRIWTFLDPEKAADPRSKVLKTLIDSFEAANPGVKIAVEPQVWQQMADKFFAAHQTGTAPDIIWMYAPRLFEAIELGSLANLDPLFIKDWPQSEIDDLDDYFWRLGASDGAHYQITHSRASAGQFYRTDLFADAGIDPKSLTTWDKFIEAAQKLTVKGGDGNVSQWGFGQAFSTEASFKPIAFSALLTKDGNPFDADGKAKWATPAGIEGLTLQCDMVTKDHITPETAVSQRTDDLYDGFTAGRFAIIRGSSARIPRMMDALGADKVGYLETPGYGDGYSKGELSGWMISVWSGSQVQEAAGKFAEYISTREADKMWVEEAGTVPMRKSTITDNAEFFAKPENAYLIGVADEITNNGWFPPAGTAFGWNEEINRAAQDVVTNGMDPKAALEAAEDRYNRAARR